MQVALLHFDSQIDHLDDWHYEPTEDDYSVDKQDYPRPEQETNDDAGE